MAAKQLPIVGEAFLGSDPMASKVVRVAVGVDTTDGVNDIILTSDTGVYDVLTVADTKFMLTDIVVRVVVAFTSVDELSLGVDSSILLFGWTSASSSFDPTVLGYQHPQVLTADTGTVFDLLSSTPNPLQTGLTFPQTSAASIVIGFDTTAATVGDIEIYFYYVETP